jgi:5-formyltetrahydrofolate cyclo-ligase
MSKESEPHDPPSWPHVQTWRESTRRRLLAVRCALPRRDQLRCALRIAASLYERKDELFGRRVAFYWPVQGEIDLVPFIRFVLRDLEAAALPVSVDQHAPLEFWRWTPRRQLYSRGLWGVPAPALRELVEPDMLLVPLLGFDGAGYRLGYGAGHYDRTLAALPPATRVLGIGHELGRLRSVYPQPHDLPMHAIVTERGFVEHGRP